MSTAVMERSGTTSAAYRKAAIVAMWVGLGLTIAATIVPFTTSALADHIRKSYPRYTDARVDTAVSTWLIILTIIGVLGVAGWLWTIWIVRIGKRGARWIATTLLVLGTGVALTDLLVEDTSGDVGLAPVLGWIGLLPCLAGFVAVLLLWRRSP
jgi:hypothetical protein